MDVTEWTDLELDYNISATADLLSLDLGPLEKAGIESLYQRCKTERDRRRAIVGVLLPGEESKP